MNIELRKYTSWPDMAKFNEEDQIDNIVIAFELAFSDGNKKELILYAVGHLLLDRYDGINNLSFNIPSRENDTDSFYFFGQEDKKSNPKLKKKTFYIENKTSSINLNKVSVLTSKDDTNGFKDLLTQFLEKDIFPEIKKISPFLDQHRITYDDKELKGFLNKYTSAMVGYFSEQNLTNLLGSKYKAVDSTLMCESLENEIPTKKHKKALKI